MTSVALILTVTCTLCYVGQSIFSKLYANHYQGPENAATPVFAATYGLIVAVTTFLLNDFSCKPSLSTLWMGITNGIVLFLFNYASINSSRRGPYAFQSMMMLFGGILCSVAFTVGYWHDTLVTRQIIGIAVMLIAFVVINIKGLNLQGRKKGFFFWVGLLFLTNGAYGILNDAQQRVNQNTQQKEMIIITFITSAIISLVFLLIQQRGQMKLALTMNGKTTFFLFACSLCAAAAINLFMLAVGVVPSYSVLATVTNGGVLVCSSLLSVLVLHEKMETHVLIGLVLACGSLLLLCT